MRSGSIGKSGPAPWLLRYVVVVAVVVVGCRGKDQLDGWLVYWLRLCHLTHSFCSASSSNSPRTRLNQEWRGIESVGGSQWINPNDKMSLVTETCHRTPLGLLHNIISFKGEEQPASSSTSDSDIGIVMLHVSGGGGLGERWLAGWLSLSSSSTQR